MDYSYKTDQGQRENNQDYTDVFFNESNVLLAILADGLGGHKAGDIASEMAVSQIGNAWKITSFTKNDLYGIQKWLDEQINAENERIYNAANKYIDLDGMGTTLVAAVILEDKVLFANVGDSRAYVYLENTIKQITEDHSFASELQRQGEITEDEAKNHYKRNALTRSLGIKGEVEVDYFIKNNTEIDLILLNSDGLSNVVTEEQMIMILKNKKTNLACKAEKLVQKAIENNATDNITVNIVAINQGKKVKAGDIGNETGRSRE